MLPGVFPWIFSLSLFLPAEDVRLIASQCITRSKKKLRESCDTSPMLDVLRNTISHFDGSGKCTFYLSGVTDMSWFLTSRVASISVYCEKQVFGNVDRCLINRSSRLP